MDQENHEIITILHRSNDSNIAPKPLHSIIIIHMTLLNIPDIGIGLWNIFEPEMSAVIGAALREGCKLLDGAAVYENESQVGDCVSRASNGTLADGLAPVPRNNLFLTSKVWCTELSSDNVRIACTRSLRDLKTEYLDLYLVHWPFAFEADDREKDPLRSKRDSHGMAVIANISIEETWRAMESLVDDGLVRAIGVSNFNIKRLQNLCNFARIKPAVNQVELHPYLPQEKLLSFCRSKNIVLQAYSPLGSTPKISSGRPRVIEDPTILRIAEKHSCTAAQVLLGWGLSRGTPVIPKTTNPDRCVNNMHPAQLDQTDLDQINNITTRIRYLQPSWAGVNCFEDDLF